MSAPEAAAGSTPADETDTSTLCHLTGTLTTDEYAGDWCYVINGERWPFRYAVLDERDTGVDARTLLLRGSFEHAGGIADDEVELTICGRIVSGSGASVFGAYSVAGTVHEGTVALRKLKDVLPPKRRRRSTKKKEEDASLELDRPAKRKRKEKPLPARPPPDEGAQLLVRWAGDDGSSREDGRYACALRGGRLHGDWAGGEPVPFSPYDDDWRYGEGAYKQRALDHVARFCAALPPPATEAAPKQQRGRKAAPPDAVEELLAEMIEFVADRAPVDVQNAYACSLHPSEYLRRWARGDCLARPLRGLNVQATWAKRLLDGSKVIEARTYDVVAKGGFANEWFWLVATPGRARQKGDTARITGCVKFMKEAVRYTSLAQWRADEPKHRIEAGSDYDWDGTGAMFGWRVARAYALREPAPGPDRKGTINSKPIPRLVPRDNACVA